ncbi:hypothetical protein M011DRAFT_476466 [Sporormia fimetaria CBS 119925]|uniref:F-box domain-containing protein n=1 Tax=Sporormia fimetaria CBS 119925 TaxID=1340428 RepID=A0A6A6VD17_9PLEO|nr:hypothetical protein M011DRAFT_476466 [Sporormia fimetaria CBS 119925]
MASAIRCPTHLTASSPKPAASINTAPAEIVEKILLNLPAAELLSRATLVCRRWHELVFTSPRIAVKLFLKPSNEVAGYVPVPPKLNPLIGQIFNFPERRHGFKIFLDSTPATGDLQEHFTIFSHVVDFTRCGRPIPNHASLHHPNASWKRMHIMQPPALDLCVYESISDLNSLSPNAERVEILARRSYLRKTTSPSGTAPHSIKTGFLLGDFCALTTDDSKIIRIHGSGGMNIFPRILGIPPHGTAVPTGPYTFAPVSVVTLPRGVLDG